jgi:hypothetical protein
MAIETTTRTARRCVWCGQGPSLENPITAEHIVAEWLMKALSGSGQLRHAYREHGADEDTRSWLANTPSFVVNATCNDCKAVG